MTIPVTRAELDAALPDVLAAPRDAARIEWLCRRPGYNQRDFVEALSLSPEHGIAGERWESAPWLRLPDGRPHPGIQISILSRRVLDLVWRDRTSVPHPGDTFVVDLLLGEDNLPVGQLLQAGDVTLRVSDVENDGCVKWKARYGADAKDWITAPGHARHRLRGVLCSIESGGILRNGDLLRVLR